MCDDAAASEPQIAWAGSDDEFLKHMQEVERQLRSNCQISVRGQRGGEGGRGRGN